MKYIESMCALCDINRWETYPSLLDESVAEHTFMVCMVSYRIALDTPEADVGDVLERALLHDLEEIGTGDIPRWGKRETDELKEALDETEERFIERAISSEPAGVQNRIEEKWRNSKNSDIEGRVVAAADLLCAIIGAWRESRVGNTALREHSDIDRGIEDAYEVCDGLPVAKEMLDNVVENMAHSNVE